MKLSCKFFGILGLALSLTACQQGDNSNKRHHVESAASSAHDNHHYVESAASTTHYGRHHETHETITVIEENESQPVIEHAYPTVTVTDRNQSAAESMQYGSSTPPPAPRTPSMPSMPPMPSTPPMPRVPSMPSMPPIPSDSSGTHYGPPSPPPAPPASSGTHYGPPSPPPAPPAPSGTHYGPSATPPAPPTPPPASSGTHYGPPSPSANSAAQSMHYRVAAKPPLVKKKKEGGHAMQKSEPTDLASINAASSSMHYGN